MHKRILGSFGKRSSNGSPERAISNGDSPEASVARGVRLFCESGGPNNSGEEVLHLPTIVEAAESSPPAATEAAQRIRKFLSKDNYQRAYVQYNAIMLVRILADNPGKSFTRNLDAKFVTTVRDLLRDGRDMSVQQILRETLDNFETQRANDETLKLLRDMWMKEKKKMEKRGSMQPGAQHRNAPFMQQPAPQQNHFARVHRKEGLPRPGELAQRVEEAKTSAKLLSQVVQSTPINDVPRNDLIKEFVERCQSASRSIQTYIHSDNPAPDEDTLLTLIETNDLLASAMSRHQRALLQARRVTGASPSPSTNAIPPVRNGAVEAPADPPSGLRPNMSFTAPPGPPPGRQQAALQEDQNPFGDHNEANRPSKELQGPIEPHDYGLPPPMAASEGPQTQSLHPGLHALPPVRGGGMHGADAANDVSDVQEQPPKQRYRF